MICNPKNQNRRTVFWQTDQKIQNQQQMFAAHSESAPCFFTKLKCSPHFYESAPYFLLFFHYPRNINWNYVIKPSINDIMVKQLKTLQFNEPITDRQKSSPHFFQSATHFYKNRRTTLKVRRTFLSDNFYPPEFQKNKKFTCLLLSNKWIMLIFTNHLTSTLMTCVDKIIMDSKSNMGQLSLNKKVRTLNSQEEVKRNLLIKGVREKYTKLEERRPVLEVLKESDKYKKLLDELIEEKIQLGGPLNENEKTALIKVKGEH